MAVERQEVRDLRQGIPHEAVLGEDPHDEIDHAGDVRGLRRDDAEVVGFHGGMVRSDGAEVKRRTASVRAPRHGRATPLHRREPRATLGAVSRGWYRSTSRRRSGPRR